MFFYSLQFTDLTDKFYATCVILHLTKQTKNFKNYKIKIFFLYIEINHIEN